MYYGSVQHLYSSNRATFMKKFQELLEDMTMRTLNHY